MWEQSSKAQQIHSKQFPLVSQSAIKDHHKHDDNFYIY